jgi:hypothetical protein
MRSRVGVTKKVKVFLPWRHWVKFQFLVIMTELPFGLRTKEEGGIGDFFILPPSSFLCPPLTTPF